MVGKAKVFGTLASIGGAMVLTIYKGVEIKIWLTSIDLLHKNEQQGSVAATHHHQHIDHNPYLGSLLAVASCFSVAFSLIIQSKISVSYPCHYSCTALICAFGALQSVVYALCFERNWSQWKLGWDVRLLASLYAGVVASGVAFPLSLWCVRMRGPLFVSIFNPLVLVLVAIASSLFLKEKLYLGSILGAAIIICGLYIVIWGKSKEMKKVNQLIPSKSIVEADLGTVSKLVDDTKSIVPINPLAVGPSIIPPIILSSDDGDNNKEILCEIEIVGRGREDP
ncbi:hypothetical protein LIER_21779 [Lithospermum erythrorhizon]|uniref:WAT1-related protein n=1 Tax=Lithospermum erythrorhizon TaxID=34254 RepID=A0AAV3QRL6_LITER